MRKLSDKTFIGYAYCYRCKEYFEDDLLFFSSVLCPNGCGYVVERGLKEVEKDRVEVGVKDEKVFCL